MAEGSPSGSHSPPEKPKYDWDDRRKGLTTAEKVCMSARPKPSPAVREKLLAGDSPQAVRTMTMRSRKSQKTTCVRVVEELNPLVQWEETCTSILNRILPLPASDIVPSTHKLAQSGKLPKGPTRAGTRQSRASSRQLGRSGSRAGSREEGGVKTPGPPATPQQPEGGQKASSASAMTRTSEMTKTLKEGEVEAERPHLGGLLKRRDTHFDPESDPELSNVVRLVQGASAARIERQVGGKIVFIHHEDVKQGGEKKGPATFGSQNVSGGHPLHIFRRKMLERHGSVQAAFNVLEAQVTRRLDMREFCDVLSRTKFCSMLEARLIYELLDADHDGNLTLPELQIGLEAVAPVISVDQLRKRLVCLGINSMIAAIGIMNGPGEDMTHVPLTLPEFAVCCKRVWVLQDLEHRGLYDAIRDPLGTDNATSRVSLSDLAAALQAISPCLLTEEVRPHLVRKHGSIEQAYEAMQDEWLESADAFVFDAAEWHGLGEREARRLFNFTDIDGSGNLERHELTGVLELSAPSLDMEECRKKVQMSHRCIEASLRGAVTHDTEELNDNLKFLMHELEEILEQLDMDRKEKLRLANFIGAAAGAKEHGITLCEFFKGIRLLTPSCVLESLRLKLLMVHRKATDAFRHVKNRRAPLGRQEFQKLLEEAGVDMDQAHGEETMDGLMDVLDIRSTGYITLTEFIAALRTSEIGVKKKLPRGESEAHSEKVVRDGLAKLSNTVTEIKQGLRTLQNDQAPAVEEQDEDPKKSRAKSMARSASAPNKMNKAGAGTMSAPQLPVVSARPSSSSSNASELKVVWTKQTVQGIGKAFGTPLDQERKRKTLDGLHSYVNVQQKVLKDGEVAIDGRYRKAALERHVSSLKRTIMPALQLRYQAGLLS